MLHRLISMRARYDVEIKKLQCTHADTSQVEVSFPIGQTGTIYDFTASPLFAEIDPTQSKFNITPNKVEIDLHKAKQGLKWSKLEGTEPIVSKSTEGKKSEIPASILNPTSDKAPSYPTSSRNGPKNWDALASEALKSTNNGGKEANDDDDDDEGDQMNGFFKKLYKDADPDTRRAMMKSYQESNGTALSTNWADVSKGPVETSPPEGLEAKKWQRVPEIYGWFTIRWFVILAGLGFQEQDIKIRRRVW